MFQFLKLLFKFTALFLNIVEIAAKVVDEGLLVEVIQELSEMFNSLTKLFGMEFTACLPRPSRPDLAAYGKIVILVSICWFLLFLEPIALRIRSVIMSYHYPERSLERVLWLYHRIMRKRVGFFKFARSRAKKKNLKEGSSKEDVMTCWEIFKAKVDRWNLLKTCWNFLQFFNFQGFGFVRKYLESITKMSACCAEEQNKRELSKFLKWSL